MRGGKQKPCLPKHYLKAEEKKTGHPCPRREWPTPEGPLLSKLMYLGAHAESGHIFTRLWDITFRGATTEEERRALGLIMAAYQDEAVRGTLWPERD